MLTSLKLPALTRHRLSIRGVVQGVGFRPFVHELAARFRLMGLVRNTTGGVLIDIEGEEPMLREFVCVLRREAPPSAVIEAIDVEELPAVGYGSFTIEASERRGATRALVSPDVATCDECLSEAADPQNRRHRYPFINCAVCGPRFTITADLPYDRERTTMAPFTMCAACHRDYTAPADRRFHAEATVCSLCGPRLSLIDRDHVPVPTRDPTASLASLLLEGRIAAIKGIGGYHLACDATHDAAVHALRSRKHRDAKPLALMVADLEMARRLCRVRPEEAALLTGTRRPIVLLRKRDGATVSEAVAPRHRDLGIMLPYTAFHHDLLRQVNRPLVMTSGNLSDEPIAYDDADALRRLQGLADYLLLHDRRIHVRCDDSVARVVHGHELIVRRARGYTPLPIRMRRPFARPILAVGGQMKNAVCVGVGEEAVLSHHIGDLDEYCAYEAFLSGVRHFTALVGCRPDVIAHDLHPAYRSTQYALESGLPLVGVQHHHAHIAACMAEHGCEGPVIGVAFDGTGYGSDGTMWGGEFLVADSRRFERVARLESLSLPGGEQAIRQPWRVAAAWLHRVYGGAIDHGELTRLPLVPSPQWPLVRQMIEKGIHTPEVTSAGRLFDAVSALLGVCHEARYDAQAAIELEVLAGDEPAQRPYPFTIENRSDDERQRSSPLIIGLTGVLRGIVDDLLCGSSRRDIASRFHSTVASVVVETCRRIRQQTGLRDVALSGGVFQNVRLLTETTTALSAAGFTVYRPMRVPPNDGGLALGQAVVANAVLKGEGFG